MRQSAKQDIGQRFSRRAQAERYRDRFRSGRRRRTHEREVAALRQLLSGLPHPAVILDVGSGPGRLAPVLSQYATRLIQADLSIHMLEVGRDDQAQPAAQTLYVQADARKLPFAAHSVDVVFCHRLLNHVSDVGDRRAILGHFARITRGVVILSCLMAPWPVRVIRRIHDRLRRGHAQRADVRDVLQDAEAAGLTLVSRTPIRFLFLSGAFYTFARSSIDA